ncbi:hypothetical protein CC80DRAFT_520047 [Byssothecium circinans]|uniref:Uncharacterized protein n=1 Tax=Byssothecium circinans TaxID=147558 RepID=A0A6A5TER8_9PLEO|nr:hypothetical protein CC80DRAFT_520047 [Byssothecium circinans]
MQFMSQSMGWADNITLAMAPLGIITTIVSAIRVGGPSWLKALIGRARENLAVAEAELMSSTSEEVCELWNGQQVVRCMGSAPIAEFICLLPEDIGNIRNDPKTYPRIKSSTLKEAVENKLLKGIKSDIVIIRNVSAAAPNISLNSHNQFWRGELRAAAVFGTILQLGVLTYSGFATYYPTLKFQNDNRPIARYAFPCTAVGTLVLVAGILVCAHVVESSTKEKRYQAREGKRTRLVWLQQTKTVNDQVFESFAIFSDDDRTVITTSRRATNKQGHATVLAFKTVLGTMVGLCGFIVQFIGLRGMHWSVSVAQLGAVLVMASVRALVRRGLAKPPQCRHLPSGFELEWFATTLGDPDKAPWMKTSNSEKEVSRAKMATRRRIP